ncbi:MAG: hypothetical protein IH596_08505 [Bacteroidales bacterium]|nr:hypothetical protein [Bacteroidales bacterium]
MKAISTAVLQRTTIASVFIDSGALLFIYLVPSISHLLSLPVYLIEPMRLMLILALVHTSKKNAYLLALTMPLFSFLISSHPVVPKMMLITFELVFNVFLFYLLTKRMKYLFPAILLSILISKIAYYLIKFGLIQMTVLDSELVSTPITIQVIMVILFSSYVYLFYKRR